MRGAASPEGYYENNRRLGNERTKVLLEELKRDLAFQYMNTEATTCSITEDYGYLCRLMKEAGDPDYGKVKAIYDACGGDELCCKRKLMAYNGQRLWRRLLREYFPRLRSARVILWFSEPDSVHLPVVEPTDTAAIIDTVTIDTVTPGPIAEEEPIVIEPIQPKVRRHVVAVRTNLVHDFFYMPRYGWAPAAEPPILTASTGRTLPILTPSRDSAHHNRDKETKHLTGKRRRLTT